ncbi:MAG: hypothetical protein J6E46_13385 [Faecalicoccus sp.]|nr:hypothetical protein [Faecalicoccus sp.]
MPLTDNRTRRFKVRIVDAMFEDNSKWSTDAYELVSLSNPLLITKAFGNNPKLIKWLELTYGTQCFFIPEDHMTYWICCCGAFNNSDEEICHHCGYKMDIRIKLRKRARIIIRMNSVWYGKAMALAKVNSPDSLRNAITIMDNLFGWLDSAEKSRVFRKQLTELNEESYEGTTQLSKQDSFDTSLTAKEIEKCLKGGKDSEETIQEYEKIFELLSICW